MSGESQQQQLKRRRKKTHPFELGVVVWQMATRQKRGAAQRTTKHTQALAHIPEKETDKRENRKLPLPKS